METMELNQMTDTIALHTNLPSFDVERRVLFVLGVLWGENGITTHMLTLAQGLQKAGWKVGLATKLADNSSKALQQSQRAINLFEANGISCYQVDFLELKLQPKNIIHAFKHLSQLNQVINDFKPSILHLHSLSSSPYVYLLQKTHGFPYLSTCHMEPKTHVSSVRLGMKFKSLTNVIVGQRVIAVSRVLRDAFIEVLGISQEKISSIHYGIDGDHFRPPSQAERLEARKNLGVSEEDKVVCMIGRLAPEKGHSILLKALATLRSQGTEIVALFAGQGYGTEEEDILDNAVNFGVRDLIHPLGYSDTRQVLWASDILVLPSQAQTEALPLVVVEAMFCGVVPIRTPGAGAVDQVDDGVNGYIMPFEDSDNLSLRLKELFENRSRIDEMSQSCICKAEENFTSNQITVKILNVYSELLQQNC